jgi:hypothetical protein
MIEMMKLEYTAMFGCVGSNFQLDFATKEQFLAEAYMWKQRENGFRWAVLMDAYDGTVVSQYK